MTEQPTTPDKVYHRRFSPDSGESLALVAKHIPDGSRVLDVGCGAGDLGEYLQSQKQCTVVGVDYSAESVAIAAKKLHTVLQLDLNEQTLDAHLDGKFDVIVMADILEHINTADAVLRSAEKCLSADGKILISIPNAGYVGALLSLYDDVWRYREEGILDRTHIRFYTKQSVMELLGDNGYDGSVCDRVVRDLLDSEFTQRLDSQVDAVRDWLLAKPEGSTYQFIVEARPKSQQHAFPPEAMAIPMSIQHIVKCYWQGNKDKAFDEEKFGITRGQMGQKNTLYFAVGAGSIGKIGKLRLDFADRRGVYHIEAIRVRDGGTCCWTSDAHDGTPDYALTTQECFSDKQQLPLTAMAYDNQAALEIVLPEVFSGDGLAIEVTLSAPIGEQNIAFCDAVSLSQYHAALQEQKRLASDLAKLHAEAGARIAYLEEVLAGERQQLANQNEQLVAEREQFAVERDQFIAVQEQLSEEKLVLDGEKQQLLQAQQRYIHEAAEAQASINQLRDECENANQYIASLLQSSSWKLTAPLRKLIRVVR